MSIVSLENNQESRSDFTTYDASGSGEFEEHKFRKGLSGKSVPVLGLHQLLLFRASRESHEKSSAFRDCLVQIYRE